MLVSADKKIAHRDSRRSSQYVWRRVSNPQGDGTIALVVSPKATKLQHWRFVYPADANLLDWGCGSLESLSSNSCSHFSPEGGRETAAAEFQDEPIIWIGSDSVITPAMGCYIVFELPVPRFVGFAVAKESFAPPSVDTLEYIVMEETVSLTDRVKQIADQVMREMSQRLGSSRNLFSFRYEPLRMGSKIWKLSFWFAGLEGVGSEGLEGWIKAEVGSLDAVIRQDIMEELEREIGRIGLGDRLRQSSRQCAAQH